MYSIKDILKKSFIEGYSASDINLKTVILALVITAVISVYIFFLYRAITRKTFYNKNFNISLIGVAMITAAIIITIQSSIVVSLGMVGALSIVRFRTAIKDPMDLMFLFWSISVGIICGAGFAEYATVLTLFLTIVVVIVKLFPPVRADLILIINADNSVDENEISERVKKYATYLKFKSRNFTSSSYDFVIELRSKEPQKIVADLLALSGVKKASILEHSGETSF